VTVLLAIGPALRHPQWLQQRGVGLRLGIAVRHVDTQARTVQLADGETLDYDDLVLATGSRPFVPPIPAPSRRASRSSARSPSTGCGGCRPDVAAILARVRA
jgi:NAD(P)H-nitrite reductase large subunit